MNNYLRILAFIGCIICTNGTNITAQSTDTLFLNLAEAIDLAVDKNPDIRRVRLGAQLLEKQIQVEKASGLPQINASAGYTDNYSLPQQLLPGEIFGQEGEIPVQFGVRYGLNAGIDIQQTLYSREYKTNLRKLDALRSTVQLQTLASLEDLIFNVIQIYIQYQTTSEQKSLLLANLDRINHLIEISQAQYENGIIKKLDVDQIRVNKTNLLSELSNLDLSLEQQLNILKFYLAVEADRPVSLTENLENEQRFPLSDRLLLSENINHQLLINQLSLAKLDDDVIKAGYYPKISAFLQYNYAGQTNKFTFNSSHYSAFWSGLWGINASIPIFDGFRKKNQLEENKIKYEQLGLDIMQLENATKMEYNNAVTKIRQNEKMITTQVENMELARNVYEITKMSYREGVAPLTELLNAETGLKEAQSQYLTALINFKLAELEHARASGQLAQLIKTNQ